MVTISLSQLRWMNMGLSRVTVLLSYLHWKILQIVEGDSTIVTILMKLSMGYRVENIAVNEHIYKCLRPCDYIWSNRNPLQWGIIMWFVLYHIGYRKKLYVYYLIILCPKGSPHFIVGVVCWLYIMTLRPRHWFDNKYFG
jgi:hypothetical protein